MQIHRPLVLNLECLTVQFQKVYFVVEKMFFIVLQKVPYMIPSCEDIVLQVVSTCLFGVQRMVEIMDMSGLILEPSDA